MAVTGRFDLTHAQWAVLEPLLPTGRRQYPQVDGAIILWVFRRLARSVMRGRATRGR
jgi:transposase